MKKRIILILPLLLLVLSACGQKPLTTENTSLDPNSVKPVEKVETAIIVPEGVYKECPAVYFSPAPGGALKDCEEYGGGRVCSYYKEIKNGQEKIKNLEYLTECHACRFYGPSGLTEEGSTKIELLGLEKKECSQGMYQKK